jgi:exo-beta-1,3-glucanase (GH17 family)
LTKSAAGRWQLLRDGKPVFHQGRGGSGSKELLAKLGGNSVRTWGVGDDTQAQLDEAQRLGITMSLGIWLRHTDDGFSYHDAKQVKEQYEKAKRPYFDTRITRPC